MWEKKTKLSDKTEKALSGGIRIYGEPILRRRARSIKKMTEEESHILEVMAKLMYDAQGCGLAATQAGVDLQLFVVDVGGGLLKLANPRILKKEGFDIIEEGCLSLPGVLVKVKRPKKILIECLNCSNEIVQFEAEGILCRALQHEIDHLNGKLIIDYAPLCRRFFLKRKLNKIAKQDNHG